LQQLIPLRSDPLCRSPVICRTVLNLTVANIQTGFGPFIASYLTSQGWTQSAIGLALSLGTVTSMASQIPAGAIVDATRRKSVVAGLSLIAFTLSALFLAISPTPLFVYLAEILHGFSSCTLGPAIAAMTLALVGPAVLGPRFGRNARFASIGNGIGAALMGACGYYISSRAVFYLTAAITLPALLTLLPLSALDSAQGPVRRENMPKPTGWDLVKLLLDRRLAVFAVCAALFTLANSAMLPLAASLMTIRAGAPSSLLIAAAIVLPQAIVAIISPKIGRLADQRGRRPVLLLGFAMLPLRGIILAFVNDPTLMVLAQALDGVAGACFGILVPLITSDVAALTGRYNLCLGAISFMIGVGGTPSTAIAGIVADRFGPSVAFIGMSTVGLLAMLLGLFAMPETRPTAPLRRPADQPLPGVRVKSRI